jgi:hypothetical protein
MTPHNRARGEVVLSIDGRERKLCVTLGALAELESVFDVVSLVELGERLGQLTASDLLMVLSVLTAGGGEAMNVAALANARIDPREAAIAVGEAFSAAFGDAA